MKAYLSVQQLILQFFIFFLAFNCFGQIDPTEQVHIRSDQLEIIHSLSKDFPNKTQVAFAIIENGATTFYGFIKTNDSISSIINRDSIFEIGSLTKVFTSTLLAKLVTDNKIQLDETINPYLNIAVKDDQKIRFIDLANHTSGLPRLPSNINLFLVDPNNPYKDYDEQKLIDYLTEEIDLTTNQTQVYAYSNLGAGLLAYTLTQVESKSYEELLQEKIFTTHQMNHTTTRRSQVENELVKGKNAMGGNTSNWDFNVLGGAGSILSSVEDLSKFVIAQFDTQDKVLALTRTMTASVNDNMNIGLGWHLIETQSGQAWIWHNGATGGYTSSMVVDTENRNGVVVLSNLSAFSPKMGNIDQMSFGLMKTLEVK